MSGRCSSRSRFGISYTSASSDCAPQSFPQPLTCWPARGPWPPHAEPSQTWPALGDDSSRSTLHLLNLITTIGHALFQPGSSELPSAELLPALLIASRVHSDSSWSRCSAVVPVLM